MAEPLSREELIEELLKLGSDDDQEILDAARKIHTAVNSAGTTWENLLAVDDAHALNDDDANEADMLDGPANSDPSNAAGEQSGGDEEAIKLIDKLLSRPNCSSELQAELRGYKEDIKAGEFDESDRHYIRALYNRLKT